jgi:hypothetical protein
MDSSFHQVPFVLQHAGSYRRTYSKFKLSRQYEVNRQFPQHFTFGFSKARNLFRDTYDEMYFDSDEEVEESTGNVDRTKLKGRDKLTNDELVVIEN